MRNFLGIFVVFLMFAQAAHANAYENYAQLCKIKEQTKINVIPTTKPVEYDFTKSLAEMQNTQNDTLNPYSFHAVTRTQGLMEGAIKLSQNIKFAQQDMPRYGGLCIGYQEINIDIEIDPKIYIAKEVHAHKCMGREVLAHELEHVKIDREIVNEYARKIGQRVYTELKQRGFVSFVPYKNVNFAGKRMAQTVNQIVEHEYKRLELDRIERQRAHDSLEEYERVSNACPDYKMKL